MVAGKWNAELRCPSDKALLRKASSKTTAMSFLLGYEEDLRAKYPETHAILDQFNARTLLPTPTLEAIKQIIQAHVAEGLRKKNDKIIEDHENKTDKPAKRSGVSGTGRYSCKFFVKVINERTDEFVIQLYHDKDDNHSFQAGLYQDAMRLVDNRQDKLESCVYATISSIENGKEMTTVIPRADSVARIMKKNNGPVVRRKSTGMSKPL